MRYALALSLLMSPPAFGQGAPMVPSLPGWLLPDLPPAAPADPVVRPDRVSQREA